MSALLVILDQLDEARAKATPGPWENPYPFTKLIDAPGSTDNLAIVQCDNAADAALIVAAVNAAPKLTAALRAVLELHPTVEIPGSSGALWCQHCQLQDDISCPTVAAITAALTPEATS